MRCGVVRHPEPRLRFGMMHRTLRSIERRCARGAETEQGKDSYNQGRPKRPDARQLHPVNFLSAIGFLAARSPLVDALRSFSSCCEWFLSYPAGRDLLLASLALEAAVVGFISRPPINQLVLIPTVTQNARIPLALSGRRVQLSRAFPLIYRDRAHFETGHRTGGQNRRKCLI